MSSIIGIDSRSFLRQVRKKDGTEGKFQSELGIAIKVKDYADYCDKYKQAIDLAFSSAEVDITKYGDYSCYCTHDLKKTCDKYNLIIENFFNNIANEIEKVHIFYTLFSQSRIPRVKVFGRKSKNEQIKLSSPYRTYPELLTEQIGPFFPLICAWRLSNYFQPHTVQFHLDSCEGLVCEAYEEFIEKNFSFSVYPGGDCSNPVIATADLLIEHLDTRLRRRNAFLLFDNIRPALNEFGDKVLVYPILGKHLPKITPLDSKPADIFHKIHHPVFWVFKGEDLLNSETMKNSESFRNLRDYAALKFGVVKLFDKNRDIELFKQGDYGVYLNTRGLEIIQSYKKIGKCFKPFDMTTLVSEKDKKMD